MLELCNSYAVSGYETPVREQLIHRLTSHCDSLKVDTLGNLIVFKEGKNKDKKIMVTVPMDEPGIIVKKITEDGYLKFQIIGRLRPEFLAFKQVIINGHSGVIGLKAVHLTTKEERERPVKTTELFIDIGASSYQEAANIITVGDYGVIDAPCMVFGKEMIKGRAIGARLGCNLMAELLTEELPIGLEVVFSVQREIGCRGICTGIRQIEAEIAIALDGMEGNPCDGVILANQTNKKWKKVLLHLAEREGVSLTSCVLDAKGQESVLLQAGKRVIAMGLPVRYPESASQVASLSDVRQAKKILQLFMEELA